MTSKKKTLLTIAVKRNDNRQDTIIVVRAAKSILYTQAVGAK